MRYEQIFIAHLFVQIEMSEMNEIQISDPVELLLMFSVESFQITVCVITHSPVFKNITDLMIESFIIQPGIQTVIKTEQAVTFDMEEIVYITRQPLNRIAVDLFFIHRDPPPSAPHPCSGEKRKGSCEPYYYFYRIFLGSKYRKKNVTQIILVDQSLIWLKVVFLSVSAGCISILE